MINWKQVIIIFALMPFLDSMVWADSYPPRSGRDAAWIINGELVTWDAGNYQSRPLLGGDKPAVRLFDHQAGKAALFATQEYLGRPDTDEGGGFDLWILDFGSQIQARQLVDQPIVWGARLSPEGDRIAIWFNDYTTKIVRLDSGKELLQIFRAGDPIWSEDGKKLLVIAPPENYVPGSLPGYFALTIINAHSGQRTELTKGYDDFTARWFNKREILFVSGLRTGHVSFWKFKDKLVQQIAPGAPPPEGQINFSSDNRYAVYEADGAEVWGLDLRLNNAWMIGAGRHPFWITEDKIVALSGLDLKIYDAAFPQGPENDRGISMGPIRSDGYEYWRERSPNVDTEPTKFRLPLASNPGVGYHVDHDADRGELEIRDWDCGDATYDGHKGSDFRASRGTNVYAGAAGYIYDRCNDCGEGNWNDDCCGGFGNHVKISHANGTSIYAHFEKGTAHATGDVTCGEQVGQSGNSGRSTGPHLHFEVVGQDPYSGRSSGAETYWLNWPPTTSCQAEPVDGYLFKVNKTGNGLVSSKTPDTGINCGADCSEDYEEGHFVTLKATADPGFSFIGWGGDCMENQNQWDEDECKLKQDECVLRTIDRDKTVTAEFSGDITYSLSVDVNNGTGGGTVRGTGINCEPDCSESYPENTSVTLQASADNNSIFAGWSGPDCSGLNASCPLLMDRDRSAVATFNQYDPGTFSDDPIQPGVTEVREDHIWELRNSINDLRHAYDLLDYNYRDPNLNIGDIIQVIHIQDLRFALNEVYNKIGDPPPLYTDPNLAGGTEIRHEHIQELRDILKTWNQGM